MRNIQLITTWCRERVATKGTEVWQIVYIDKKIKKGMSCRDIIFFFILSTSFSISESKFATFWLKYNLLDHKNWWDKFIPV